MPHYQIHSTTLVRRATALALTLVISAGVLVFASGFATGNVNTSSAFQGDTTATPVATEAPSDDNKRNPRLPDYQSEPTVLVFDETLENTLTAEQDLYIYEYSAVKGEVIQVTVETASSDLDIRHTFAEERRIYNPYNQMDGGGYDGGSFQRETETYTLRSGITMYGDSKVWFEVMKPVGEAISYTITLEKIEIPQLAYGDTLSVNYWERETFYFTARFEGKVGDIIDLDIQAPADTSLTLATLDGREIVVDDDSGGHLNPALYHFVLPAAATYSILIDTNSGQYAHYGDERDLITVTLTEVAPLRLDGEGSARVGLKHNVPSQVVALDVVAGQTYTLTARGEGPSEPPALDLLVVQNGVALTRVDLAISDNASAGSEPPDPVWVEYTFTALEDGTAKIILAPAEAMEDGSYITVYLTVVAN